LIVKSPEVDCIVFEDEYGNRNLTRSSFIQRLTGKDKYILKDGNKTITLDYNYTTNSTFLSVVSQVC
jgi:hypothetical protein